MRKNFQHIQIEKSKVKSDVIKTNHYLTAEGIQLKSNYSEVDIEGLEHLDFGAGFAPNLRGIHSTMYIQQAWEIHKKTDFTIDTVEDMKEWINQPSTNEISVLQATSNTILPIMAFYCVAAEELNLNPEQLSRIIQNEISTTLKIPQSYQHSLRICTDILEYNHTNKSKLNPILISGCTLEKAGTTVDKQLAYTLIYGLEIIKTGLTKGMKIDDLASQISFSFNVGMNHFTEIAKMRAARMIWAKLIQPFEPKETKSLDLRIHSQTVIANFSSPTPLDNLTRMTIEAIAAVLGGTESLMTNSIDDENLPKKHSDRIAKNTQLILQNETKINKTVDPWAGSFYVESLTNEIVQKTWEIIEAIENIGGMTQAIASGFVKINDKKESKEFRAINDQKLEPIHPNRDTHKVQLALDTLANATKTGKGNLLEITIQATKNGATFDEIVNNSIN